jgi:hypothetical protein
MVERFNQTIKNNIARAMVAAKDDSNEWYFC